MVDLDSNPTKLIEIVEIGKQLLMTRGALTTFSIANDVAKYFAIIPAMFVAFYPQLQALNIMHLATPQSAILSAIIFNALIISALKMIADRMALCGVARSHDVQRLQLRIEGEEHGRDDGEILGHVVGDGERRERAARHQQLLADLDDLDELGRIGVEVDHVAGLARRLVPVFMATPTSACASAGASLVPSPHMATSLPLACSSRISLSFSSGVAWARKSSTPASAAMAAAVIGLSPVIMMVRMPMRRSSAKRSRMPPLTMSLRWIDAEQPAVLGHGKRRAAGLGDLLGDGVDLARSRSALTAALRAAAAPTLTALELEMVEDRVDRALADP